MLLNWLERERRGKEAWWDMKEQGAAWPCYCRVRKVTSLAFSVKLSITGLCYNRKVCLMIILREPNNTKEQPAVPLIHLCVMVSLAHWQSVGPSFADAVSGTNKPPHFFSLSNDSFGNALGPNAMCYHIGMSISWSGLSAHKFSLSPNRYLNFCWGTEDLTHVSTKQWGQLKFTFKCSTTEKQLGPACIAQVVQLSLRAPPCSWVWWATASH